MPIVHLESNRADAYPTGTYCRLNNDESFPLVISESHHGLCLFESEMNGYNDSDFYMTVWDEEESSPKKIMFATTRGWCQPCFASRPDATEEVWEKYKAWKKGLEEERKHEARMKRRDDLLEIRADELKVRRKYGVSFKNIIRLRKAFGGFLRIKNSSDIYPAMLNLLVNNRIRSKFKLSLRSQVVQWLERDYPDYDKPLSPKQLQYV